MSPDGTTTLCNVWLGALHYICDALPSDLLPARFWSQYQRAERRRRIHLQPQKLSSVVVAQGAAYGCQGLDRQGDESGI
jgi:hypothetical protein